MYAISTTDTRKFVALAESVSAAFNADVMQGQQAISINDGQDTHRPAGPERLRVRAPSSPT